MKPVNPFEQFNKQFFTSAPTQIYWYDKEGIFNLDKERVVILQMEESTTIDNYDGYRVKIVNGLSGAIITNKIFSFKFHIPHWKHPDSKYYYAWHDNNKIDWYINRPEDTESMVTTIFDYINRFK